MTVTKIERVKIAAELFEHCPARPVPVRPLTEGTLGVLIAELDFRGECLAGSLIELRGLVETIP